ncbi:MAG: sulfate ABC transporter ATP-binding protein [Gemmatimonadales bacterium]|nr:MAG: sulfate ABC transporter ATP-binding protein [Gemmatimonadales bacterium]
MLSARDVEHYYGRRRVLEVPEISVRPGEVLAVVGPNGSGKSTLLRILACVERPTRGTIAWRGQPVKSAAQLKEIRRRVTLVEQHPWLFRGKVKDNVRFPLELRRVGAAEAERRVADSLAMLSLEGLAGRDTRELSQGEIQKVAIARALACDPEILLLDEPASAADPRSAAALYRLLDQLRARGIGLCLASHQLEEAYRWADRVVALAEGRPSPVTPENLFRTEIPEGSGPRRVQAGPLELYVLTDRSGPATVAIPPEDIVVSTEPLHSSARNQFTGRVLRISDDGRGKVTLTVDVGTELVARITKQALDELDLTVGSPVVLTVKTMAVRVF